MNISEEPMVSKKADFTISIENGAIQITDRSGKRGGSVSSSSGRKLSWRNETGGNRPCWGQSRDPPFGFRQLGKPAGWA